MTNTTTIERGNPELILVTDRDYHDKVRFKGMEWNFQLYGNSPQTISLPPNIKPLDYVLENLTVPYSWDSKQNTWSALAYLGNNFLGKRNYTEDKVSRKLVGYGKLPKNHAMNYKEVALVELVISDIFWEEEL